MAGPPPWPCRKEDSPALIAAGKTTNTVALELPMRLSVRTWETNHNSVSVDYGPLTFSLKIAERLVRVDSAKTAINDSRWQAGADASLWPSWEIHPASPWNYGLELDARDPAGSMKIQRRPWPASGFPFTLADVPLALTAKARRIPQWTLDQYGLVATLPDSPVVTDQPLETVTLVPMGAAPAHFGLPHRRRYFGDPAFDRRDHQGIRRDA